MPKTTVLIVADGEESCREIKSVLFESGDCDVSGPFAALEALRACGKHLPDVILIDLQLRDIGASEFATLIRGRHHDASFVTLSFGQPRSRNGVPHADPRLADGYIRPTDIARLPQQVVSLTNRSAQSRLSSDYRGAHLDASFDRVRVMVDGVRVDLARRELALLQFLVSHPDRVLRREDILTHVWRNENDGRSRTVDVHVRRLRQKLGAAGRQIETVAGLGYRFSEPVSSASAGTAAPAFGERGSDQTARAVRRRV